MKQQLEWRCVGRTSGRSRFDCLGGQACFFNFPTVTGPGGDDPAIARLTFVVFGVPAIWLVGIIVVFIYLAFRRDRRRVD